MEPFCYIHSNCCSPLGQNASEKDIFNVNDNVYVIHVTLLRTDYSFNIVKGIYVLAHNGI